MARMYNFINVTRRSVRADERIRVQVLAGFDIETGFYKNHDRLSRLRRDEGFMDS